MVRARLPSVPTRPAIALVVCAPRNAKLRAHLTLALMVVALVACRTPATEVLVLMNTNAPTARMMTVVASVQLGASIDASGEAHTFTRGGALGRDLLPGSFAVTPGAGPHDGRVTMVVEASLESGGPDTPSVRFRRIARFAFTPGVT